MIIINIDDIKRTGAPKATNILIIDSGVNNTTNAINYVLGEPNTDYLNHGTIVAQIITSINPLANIYSAKVVDRGGTTVNDKVVQALLYAVYVNKDIDMINISLGLQSYSKTVQELINQLHDRGVLIICAAGNTYSVYPALYDNTISVGATDDNNNIESYSALADIYTYGSVTINNKTYRGTSFATAIYTGLLSLDNNKGDDN